MSIPPPSQPAHDASELPAKGGKGEVRLDAGLQARLLEQMREEQAAGARRTRLLNWVIGPLALVALGVGVALSFSDDLGIAMVANLVATSIGYVLYRINRPRIRALLGLS